MPTRKIGIVNGGGDCAGLNAVISAVVKNGSRLGYEFLGFEKGWEGVLDRQYRVLDQESVRGIAHLGGTILRTTNKGRFGAKVGEGNVARIADEVLKQTAASLEALDVEGLIVIGGDGTLTGALQLTEYGINIVGVPKTIDNDLQSTDRTFGFSTAVQIAADAIDRIHTTASSHDRTIFVECMGRHAGWISLHAGLAGGANAILLPEFSFQIEDFVKFLRDRKERSMYSTVVVIAEGVRLNNRLASHSELTSDREVLLGGVSSTLMREVEAMAPDEFEMRNVVLGHTQRGGMPNAEDRILSKEYGVAAMDAYAEGRYGEMVCLREGRMQTVPISTAVSGLKLVTEDCYEYQAAKKLGIFVH